MGRPVHTLSSGALEKLRGYAFPGNVRELENILERALIFCEGTGIESGDIELHSGGEPRPKLPVGGNPLSRGRASAEGSGEAPAGALEEIEKQAILAALARCGGNRTRAAEELGITRKTILNKLKAYGISGV
jgi:two-component system response regulator AtoC